jgi:hypothetical protein
MVDDWSILNCLMNTRIEFSLYTRPGFMFLDLNLVVRLGWVRSGWLVWVWFYPNVIGLWPVLGLGYPMK